MQIDLLALARSGSRFRTLRTVRSFAANSYRFLPDGTRLTEQAAVSLHFADS
jgi:hypothetical protein